LVETNISQWAITSVAWSAMAKNKDVQILASNPTDQNSHFRKDREVIELELWTYYSDVITTDNC
jgi:hypothetical protein